jgi:hypothetical protein
VGASGAGHLAAGLAEVHDEERTEHVEVEQDGGPES